MIKAINENVMELVTDQLETMPLIGLTEDDDDQYESDKELLHLTSSMMDSITI